jgi:hypothetical protein
VEASGRFVRLFPQEIARFFSGGGRGAWLESYYRDHVFPLLAKRFADSGFQGACGIDALVYRAPDGSPALRPVVEINPRFTMGRVALELRRLAHSTAVVRLTLATVRSARTEACRTLPELADRLETADPVRLVTQGEEVKIAEGTIVLNDPLVAQRFLAVLTVRALTGTRTPRCLGPKLHQT